MIYDINDLLCYPRGLNDLTKVQQEVWCCIRVHPYSRLRTICTTLRLPSNTVQAAISVLMRHRLVFKKIYKKQVIYVTESMTDNWIINK